MQTFKKFLIEGKNEIIAYHGSPYKFSEFNYDRLGEHGQIGADFYFFFTLNKKNAIPFALQYSSEYYDDLKRARRHYEDAWEQVPERQIKLWRSLSNKEQEHIFNYLEKELNEPRMSSLLKSEEKFFNKFFDAFIKTVGMRTLRNSPFKRFLDIIDDFNKKFEKKYNIDVENIKSKYDDQLGYLYTVKIYANNIETLQGEKIGTNWERFHVLSTVFNEGADVVIIKNADTGIGGITDEVAVEDPKKIKIINIEEVN